MSNILPLWSALRNTIVRTALAGAFWVGALHSAASAPADDSPSLIKKLIEHHELRDQAFLEALLPSPLVQTVIESGKDVDVASSSEPTPRPVTAVMFESNGADTAPSFDYRLFTMESGRIADYGRPLAAELRISGLERGPCLSSSRIDDEFGAITPDFYSENGKLMKSFAIDPDENAKSPMVVAYGTDAATRCVDKLMFRQFGEKADAALPSGSVIEQPKATRTPAQISSDAKSIAETYDIINMLVRLRRHQDLRDAAFFEQYVSFTKPVFSLEGRPLADRVVARGQSQAGHVPYAFTLITEGTRSGWPSFAGSDLPAVASIVLHDIPSPLCITRAALKTVFGKTADFSHLSSASEILEFAPADPRYYLEGTEIGGQAGFATPKAECADWVELYQVERKAEPPPPPLREKHPRGPYRLPLRSLPTN